jgi:hypothetical protein
VIDAAWLGHRDSDRLQYYEWPAQGYPSGGDWTIWRKAIAQAFDVSNRSRALPLALGPWIDPPDTWRWFLSENDDRLYYRSAPNVWQFCIRHPRRQRNYVFKNRLFNISNSDLPDDLRRTVISRSGQLIFAFGSARDEWRDLPATAPTTFAAYLKTLPKDAQWAPRDINLTDDGLTITQKIRSGTAIGISDGLVGVGRALTFLPYTRGQYCSRRHGGSRFLSQRTLWLVRDHNGSIRPLRILQH